jgi:hypothetical protein
MAEHLNIYCVQLRICIPNIYQIWSGGFYARKICFRDDRHFYGTDPFRFFPNANPVAPVYEKDGELHLSE